MACDPDRLTASDKFFLDELDRKPGALMMDGSAVFKLRRLGLVRRTDLGWTITALGKSELHPTDFNLNLIQPSAV